MQSMRIPTTATAAIFSLVVLSGSARAADWPTARGNAQRTGISDGQPGP
jgi:hypothetical protein